MPQPNTHSFPLVHDADNNPIIRDAQNGGPYTSTSVQVLFTQQAAIPVTAENDSNPDLAPATDSLDPRFDDPGSIYHVTLGPRRVPFALAMRLIQV